MVNATENRLGMDGEGGPSKFDYYVKIIEKRQNKTNKDAL